VDDKYRTTAVLLIEELDRRLDVKEFESN